MALLMTGISVTLLLGRPPRPKGRTCGAGRLPARRLAPLLGLILTPLYGLLLAAAWNGACLAGAASGKTTIPILFVQEKRDTPPPLSLLDFPPPDEGAAGAKLAIADNNTTGRFLNQEFTLDTVNGAPAELLAQAQQRAAGGLSFIAADVEPGTLVALADALAGQNVMIFNAGTPDESVREENCRANVLHTIPSRSMFTDALAQYMAWKQWRRWFLVTGPGPHDAAYAGALRTSARRFGIKIVEERAFAYDPGSRRSDGGFEQIQQQIPSFTQRAAEHDVVAVADEDRLFGDYLPYRTWEPRPVIGTAGLFATSWHPAFEQWGATQFQNRFRRLAGRPMRPLDYTVWMAVRAVGEAAARKHSGSGQDLIPYFKSPEFELAAFKGQKLTFREWNGQLRQPILLATAAIPVSVSPQPGFLHQLTELDTLGMDRAETRCKLKAAP